MNHDLKTLPEFFEAVKCGDKMFECRRNDRGFQKSDTVTLKKFNPKAVVLIHQQAISGYMRNGYSEAKPLVREITYVLTGEEWGIKDGYAVLGLKEIEAAK